MKAVKPDRPRNDSIWSQFGRYSTLAFLLPSAMFIGYVMGYLLDRLFGTTFLRIVFFFLGIIAGFVSMVRELSKTNGR
jgi:F0F1-type ATP synthase assembly protein I